MCRPGQTKYGPETPAGHLPSYTDNGVAHCLLSSLMFLGGSNLGLGEPALLGVALPPPPDCTHAAWLPFATVEHGSARGAGGAAQAGTISA